MGKDIDDIRDEARDDAGHQKDLERGDLRDNLEALISPKYDPPSDPTDKEEYDRVYRDEKNR